MRRKGGRKGAVTGRGEHQRAGACDGAQPIHVPHLRQQGATSAAAQMRAPLAPIQTGAAWADLTQRQNKAGGGKMGYPRRSQVQTIGTMRKMPLCREVVVHPNPRRPQGFVTWSGSPISAAMRAMSGLSFMAVPFLGSGSF